MVRCREKCIAAGMPYSMYEDPRYILTDVQKLNKMTGGGAKRAN